MSTRATRNIMGAELSRMIDSFESYCAAFFANEGRVIGEDGYAAEFARDIANSLSTFAIATDSKHHDPHPTHT